MSRTFWLTMGICAAIGVAVLLYFGFAVRAPMAATAKHNATEQKIGERALDPAPAASTGAPHP